MAKMTSEEFKAARLKLGLTVNQLAAILDKNHSTIARWEASPGASTKTAIDPTSIRVVEWMLDGFRPPQWPANPRAMRRGRIPKGEA